MIEGKPICLIREGVFSIQNFRKEILSEDEFFAEFRMNGVSQLGQIEQQLLKTSGSISIFYYPDKGVKAGLPIMPDSLESSIEIISKTDNYSCIFCGHTEEIKATPKHIFPTCTKLEWVKASSKKRIS